MSSTNLTLNTEQDWIDYEQGGHKIKKNIELKDDYLYNLMNEYDNTYSSIQKDYKVGEMLPVKSLYKIVGDTVVFETNGGNQIFVDLTKEKRYLNKIGYTINDFKDRLHNTENFDEFVNTTPKITLIETSEYLRGSLMSSHVSNLKTQMTEELDNPNRHYIAKVIERNGGGFMVDIEGMIAFLPGGQAAANKITDFDSYIGKEIPVMVTNYETNKGFIVSNKLYIQNILPEKIQNLDLSKEYSGTVTGTKNFGIFIEFDTIFTGLIHVSEMDEETLELFNTNKFKPNTPISFWIKNIENYRKITLTKKDPNLFIEQVNDLKDTKVVLSGKVKKKVGNKYRVLLNNYNDIELKSNLIGYIGKDHNLQYNQNIEITISNYDPSKSEVALDLVVK